MAKFLVALALVVGSLVLVTPISADEHKYCLTYIEDYTPYVDDDGSRIKADQWYFNEETMYWEPQAELYVKVEDLESGELQKFYQQNFGLELKGDNPLPLSILKDSQSAFGGDDGIPNKWYGINRKADYKGSYGSNNLEEIREIYFVRDCQIVDGPWVGIDPADFVDSYDPHQYDYYNETWE